MATIVYLDVEDEITSAAARIRTAPETRVALVLPYGSRLATSRINFRLLAREAMAYGRRLDLIAPDAAARALAASAGLPVYGSVPEYEAALEAPADDADDPEGAQRAAPSRETKGAAASAAGVGAGAAAGSAAPRSLDARPGGSGAQAEDGSVVKPGTGGAGRELRREPRRDEPRPDEPRVVHARRLPRIGTGAVVGFGIFAFALLAAGVAGFVFLPHAEITVTPRVEAIGPISFTVRADPDATDVDAAGGVIPALALDVPVESSGEFQATGKRVEEAKATGSVRWTNCDFLAAYSIPKGTIVKTASGIAFTTDEAMLLPQAKVSGTPPNLTVTCQTNEVSVTASAAGPEGNVAAGTIKVVPARYNRTVISVTNPAPTTGGKRDEFPQVAQKDVDAAVEQLRKDLETQFATALENGAGAPAGTTVFPDTATLDEPVPDVDPATLVGQETASFTLGLQAMGHVLAVDSSPVKAIADDRLQGSVSADHELMAGSISVTVGDGTVVDGVVTFPVEGSAQQIRVLDATALRQQVLGLGRADAQRVLEAYGQVTIDLWPDWVSSVPSLEQRVTLQVAAPGSPATSPAPSASDVPASASPPDAAESPSGDAAGGEPVPSG
jgi:hypothetical protein